MKVITTALSDVMIFEPTVYGDTRGFFMESFNRRRFVEATGVNLDFVQDNHSRSVKGVLRGLHYQLVRAQGKLVRAATGAVFDVAVDLRKRSSNFGKWVGAELTEDNQRQLWIPPGFAHGFLVLSEQADFVYKTTEYYAPQYDRCLRWDDSDIGIEWPITSLQGEAPILSKKDQLAPCLAEAELYDGPIP